MPSNVRLPSWQLCIPLLTAACGTAIYSTLSACFVHLRDPFHHKLINFQRCVRALCLNCFVVRKVPNRATFDYVHTQPGRTLNCYLGFASESCIASCLPHLTVPLTVFLAANVLGAFTLQAASASTSVILSQEKLYCLHAPNALVLSPTILGLKLWLLFHQKSAHDKQTKRDENLLHRSETVFSHLVEHMTHLHGMCPRAGTESTRPLKMTQTKIVQLLGIQPAR